MQGIHRHEALMGGSRVEKHLSARALADAPKSQLEQDGCPPTSASLPLPAPSDKVMSLSHVAINVPEPVLDGHLPQPTTSLAAEDGGATTDDDTGSGMPATVVTSLHNRPGPGICSSLAANEDMPASPFDLDEESDLDDQEQLCSPFLTGAPLPVLTLASLPLLTADSPSQPASPTNVHLPQHSERSHLDRRDSLLKLAGHEHISTAMKPAIAGGPQAQPAQPGMVQPAPALQPAAAGEGLLDPLVVSTGTAGQEEAGTQVLDDSWLDAYPEHIRELHAAHARTVQAACKGKAVARVDAAGPAGPRRQANTGQAPARPSIPGLSGASNHAGGVSGLRGLSASLHHARGQEASGGPAMTGAAAHSNDAGRGAGPSCSMSTGLGAAQRLPATFDGPPPGGRKKARIASAPSSDNTKADPTSRAYLALPPGKRKEAHPASSAALPASDRHQAATALPLAPRASASVPANRLMLSRSTMVDVTGHCAGGIPSVTVAPAPTQSLLQVQAMDSIPNMTVAVAHPDPSADGFKAREAAQQMPAVSPSQMVHEGSWGRGAEMGASSQARRALHALADWRGMGLEQMAQHVLGLSRAERDGLRQAYANAHPDGPPAHIGLR